jgi:hypothetical protein
MPILPEATGVLLLNSYCWKRILRAAKIVIKGFSEAANSHISGLLKTTAYNISNAAKN